MSKTLINGVNEVLKKTGTLDSDSGLLTSLTNSGRQVFIDTAVQVLNEAVDDLYASAQISKPKQLREATITLVSGTKDYALHSSLVLLRDEFNLIDETNNHIIAILGENGYWQTVVGDLDQDDTGLPSFCAISPINGRLVFDRTPTSVEDGNIYKYRYDRDMELELANDSFPFNNIVFRAVVPAAAEMWKFYRQQEFQSAIYNRSMARAARYLRQLPPRTSYAARQVAHNETDPLHAS
ncbi:MAG: hypothetical protein V3U60_11035 [Gammaproteobacteria bacterium]